MQEMTSEVGRCKEGLVTTGGKSQDFILSVENLSRVEKGSDMIYIFRK